MHLGKTVEHFVTLFDSNYLPMGLCLHSSLMQRQEPFRLWIVCMDALAVEQLKVLDLPNVTLLPLAEVETPALLTVKPIRSRGEYCWTLTPFAPQFVFERDASASRVTYLDADVFLYDSPQILLRELEESGKDVLITPHAYAPEYERSALSGIYCVQFMTFLRSEGGMQVMRWWQERCLEWCYDRYEDGKFGDQKYLDDWPVRFPSQVHVLRQVEKTLAPWNVGRFYKEDGGASSAPVLYHFHSMKLVSPSRLLLFRGYRVRSGLALYARYIEAMKTALQKMRKNGMVVPVIAQRKNRWDSLREIKRRLLGTASYSEV
jgi:hypothetical protein